MHVSFGERENEKSFETIPAPTRRAVADSRLNSLAAGPPTAPLTLLAACSVDGIIVMELIL